MLVLPKFSSELMQNQNQLNRTDNSVQFQFSLATPVVSSVLGSQISKILRTGSEPVQTGPNCYYFKRKSPGNNQEITLIFDINGDIVGVSTLTSTDSRTLSTVRSGPLRTRVQTKLNPKVLGSVLCEGGPEPIFTGLRSRGEWTGPEGRTWFGPGPDLKNWVKRKKIGNK